MLHCFKFESDLKLVQTFDWNAHVDGTLPFGGVESARVDRLLSRDVLTKTLRLTVRDESRAAWVEQVLKEEGFGECQVREIGQPRGGFRTVQIIAESQETANRMVTEGIYIGGQISEPEHWQFATKLCTLCWRHHDRRRQCSRKTCCGRCSNSHAGRCEAVVRQCPNCKCDHSVYSKRCVYRHKLYRNVAERTGLPLPRFVKSSRTDFLLLLYRRLDRLPTLLELLVARNLALQTMKKLAETIKKMTRYKSLKTPANRKVRRWPLEDPK